VRVVVLDSYSPMGLAVANALDPRYELIGGIPDRSGLRLPPFERLLKSRRLETIFRYPEPQRDPDGFRDAILAAARRPWRRCAGRIRLRGMDQAPRAGRQVAHLPAVP